MVSCAWKTRAGHSPRFPDVRPIECASEWQFWELSSRPSNRPVRRTRRGSCAWKSSFQKISPGISPSPKISPEYPRPRKYPRNPRNIPEISPVWMCKKASVFAALRKISPISPISPGCRGCVSRAVKTLSHAWTFAREIHEIPEIPEISTSHKTRKPAQMLAFLKISTISTKSTGCHGRVSRARRMGLSPRAGHHGSRKPTRSGAGAFASHPAGK